MKKKILPRVAILLATYNGEKYLAQQLQSILNQEKVVLSIYISDDQSTDNTRQIIKNFSKDNKNINVINYHRVGGPAKNFYFLLKTLQSNNFDYIALSDQDDLWNVDKIFNAITKIIQTKSDCYSCDVIAFRDDLPSQQIYIKKSYAQKKLDFYFETPGPGCTFVFNTNFFNYLKTKLSGKTLDFQYHDWLIYALARFNNFKWYIDNNAFMYYRQHKSNFMGANYNVRAYLKRVHRILFGEYYKELVFLYKILNPSKNLDFITVWFFIINFYNTRRKFTHTIMMIPFLIIVSLQKNG